MNLSGNVPVARDLFTIQFTIGAISSAIALSSLLGIRSWLIEDLGLRLFMTFSVSSSVCRVNLNGVVTGGILVMYSCIGILLCGMSEETFFAIVAKYVLNISATFVESSVKVSLLSSSAIVSSLYCLRPMIRLRSFQVFFMSFLCISSCCLKNLIFAFRMYFLTNVFWSL